LTGCLEGVQEVNNSCFQERLKLLALNQDLRDLSDEDTRYGNF